MDSLLSVSRSIDWLIDLLVLFSLIFQDNTLDKIGSSVGVLKDMSQKIGSEITEHMVIMDDLGNSMERTDTAMGAVMKKLNKVSKMADDKTQWTVLIGLVFVLFIVILLFFVL